MNDKTLRFEMCGLGFLFKKIEKIKPRTLATLIYVPEFIEVLQNYKGNFNDQVIYDLLMARFLQMCEDGNCYRAARNSMSKISRDVTGLTLKEKGL